MKKDNHEDNENIKARVRKQGDRLRSFVEPNGSIYLTFTEWQMERIKANLLKNKRVVLVDPDNDDDVFDLYNYYNSEGKLVVCGRTLNPWKAKVHEQGGTKYDVEWRGKKIDETKVNELRSQVREYRNKARAQRIKAVPHRIIKAECPKCGEIFEVELGGLTND